MREFEKLYCGRYYEIDRDQERVEDAVFPCERASISCWTWKTYMIYPCNTGLSRNSSAWETSVNVDSKQRTGR